MADKPESKSDDFMDELDKEIKESLKELDEFEGKKDKIETPEELLDSADKTESNEASDDKEDTEKPETSTNQNDGAEDKSSQTPSDNSQENKQPSVAAPRQGMSQAYVEVPECDVYGNPINKTSDKVKKDYPTPPKRGDKPKKDDKESSIMDLFWKDFILASYDWVIDTTVDLGLDFVDYVLYHRKEETKEEKKEKLDVFAMGSKIRDETKEKMLKKKEISLNAYQEIVNNLEKEKQGKPAEWKLLKKEPSFFKELSRINKKNELERTPGEKELMVEFKNVPEVMNRMINEGIRLKEMAIAGASCECAANYSDGQAVSSKFAESLEALEKGIKNNNNPEINKSMKELNQEVDLDVPLYNEIRNALISVKDDIGSNKSNSALEKIKEIKEKCSKELDSPDHWKKVVFAKQKSYFEEMEKEKEAINNQDKHSITPNFESYLSLLKQSAQDAPLQENKDKTTLLSSLENLTTKLDSKNQQEAIIQKHLTKVLEKNKDVEPKEIASKLTAEIEDFNSKFPNLDKDVANSIVSKEFFQGLKAFSESVKTTQKRQTENQKIVSGCLDKMVEECDTVGDKGSEMKSMLEEVKKSISSSEAQQATSILSEHLPNIEDKHRNMNPIRKEKQEYYNGLLTSIKALKITIDDYTKGTNPMSKSSKKKKMNDSLKSMKSVFTSHGQRASTQSQRTVDSQAISMEILKHSDFAK